MMTRRWLRIGIVLAVVLPLTLAAQRRFRGSPGNNPNPNVTYDGRFTFVRVRFEPLGGSWDLKWDHDYPRAESHFMKILQEVTGVRPRMDGSNILPFDDPELFKYPVAYVSEPGFWTMSPTELQGVRDYVAKGGFIIFDDFAGEHWYNFEARWREAFPSLKIVPLELGNQIFDSFFHIESLEMTHPMQGVPSQFLGAYEDNDPTKRLVMIANYNNDIGDYMEFSDEGFLPISLTNEAYKLAVNYVIYAMTH
ncbi:MAG: DUF4159 domain-containing protein [Gemmatimonadaceae bacterium]|nr:DUF4159 domain-containing protein [Gemmatimonadaceae bacterium]